MANTAKLLLLVLPVSFVSYYVGRNGAIQTHLAFREHEIGGRAVTSPLGDQFRAGPSIYVPAYSHIYVENGQGSLLTVTLSVRNVSPDRRIVLDAVDYYDTSGERVRRYLESPLELAPLETAEFLVVEDDTLGGSGANFMVQWRGQSGIPPPLTEAIMVGKTGAGMISFGRAGIPVPGTAAPVRAAASANR